MVPLTTSTVPIAGMQRMGETGCTGNLALDRDRIFTSLERVQPHL